MPHYFKGEVNYTFHYSVKLKDLPPLKRVMAILCFVLWIPFALLLFVPGLLSIGIIGLIASLLIYIPLAILYIAGLKGKQRTVPYAFTVIGILGLVGYIVISAYLKNNRFTPEGLLALIFIPLFLIFLIVGIILLRLGIQRNNRWKTYSIAVMATVVDHKTYKTQVSDFRHYNNSLYRTGQRATLYSPVIQYNINGITYHGEINAYFGKSQVTPPGSAMEIHVNPRNPADFMMHLQKGGMFIAMGISFIITSVFIAVIAAVALVLLQTMH